MLSAALAAHHFPSLADIAPDIWHKAALDPLQVARRQSHLLASWHRDSQSYMLCVCVLMSIAAHAVYKCMAQAVGELLGREAGSRHLERVAAKRQTLLQARYVSLHLRSHHG